MAGSALGFFNPPAESALKEIIMTYFNNTTTAIHRRALVTLAAALALSLGAASPAFAVPACKIDVFVKNEQSASIKVLRFKYSVKDKSGTFIESLSNKRLAPGETEEWPNQALREAGEGNLITNTWVEYKRDNSGAGDGYGPPEWSKPFPHSSTYTCLNDRNYWLAARQDD
ncbi:MAG: hypothetical protein ABI589_06885 [Burkholderiales bacterium]